MCYKSLSNHFRVLLPHVLGLRGKVLVAGGPSGWVLREDSRNCAMLEKGPLLATARPRSAVVCASVRPDLRKVKKKKNAAEEQLGEREE